MVPADATEERRLSAATSPASYHLLSVLGEGGMGRVYRAQHQPSGRLVALKRLRPELAADPALRRLLLDEATAAARVEHERIVRLLDIGREANGTPFLVMEYVEGTSLASAVARWPGWGLVARAVDDVLEGLVAAHAAGIVHRDLKPANVLVDAQGRGRILDFGVASVVDASVAASRLQVAGTPAYMALEQLRGEPARPSTDLYALGVLLFELLRGELPFEGTDFDALLRAKEAPPALRPRAGLALPSGMEDLVRRLLAPSFGDRPRFARAVREEFSSLSALVREDPEALALAAPGARQEPSTGRKGGLVETLAEEPTELWSVGGATVAQGLGAPCAAPAEEWGLLPAAPEGASGLSLLRLREPALVGREEERALLEEEARRVQAEKRARVVLLVGGAGVGKSRLARWLLSTVEARGAMERVSVSFDGARGEGLRRGIQRLLGSAGEGGAQPRWRWLRDAGALPTELARLEGWLAEREQGSPAASARLACLALELASRARPVALLLDDLGWSQDGALELVEQLVAAPSPAVLLLATMREDTAQHPRLLALRGRAEVRTLGLEGLAEPALEDLLAASARLPTEVSAALARAAQGAALVAVQLLHDWLESGALEPTESGFALRPGVGVESLLRERPVAALSARRVQAFVRSFEGREAVARGALLRAALLGQRFRYETLQGACALASPSHAEALEEVLEHALLHGLLRAEEARRYRFDHELLHEAVRLECAPEEGSEGRFSAHRDAASALLGEAEVTPAARAHGASLLRAAGDAQRAAELLAEAAEEQATFGDDERAGSFLARLAGWLEEEAVPAVDPRRARLSMAECLRDYFALRFEAARARLRGTRELYRALGDEPAVLRCDLLEASLLFYEGRYRASERCLQRLLATARPAQLGVAALTQLETRFAELYFTRGDLAATREHFLRARRIAEGQEPPWRFEATTLNLAELHLACDEVEDAAALLAQLHAAHAGPGEHVMAEPLAVCSSRLSIARGEEGSVAARVQGLLHAAQRRGERWQQTALWLLVALCSVALDEGAQLRGSVRSFLDAFREVPHDDPYTVWGMARLARALRARGEEPLAAELEALRARRLREWEEGWRED